MIITITPERNGEPSVTYTGVVEFGLAGKRVVAGVPVTISQAYLDDKATPWPLVTELESLKLQTLFYALGLGRHSNPVAPRSGDAAHS